MTTLHLEPADLSALCWPGNAYTLVFTWSESIEGRTFTARLGAQDLPCTVDGDELLVEISEAVTADIDRPSASLLVTETTGGGTQDIAVGTWRPTTHGTATPSSTEVTVTVVERSVAVSVLGGLIRTGNIDGGTPASLYGGTNPIDGGTP